MNYLHLAIMLLLATALADGRTLVVDQGGSGDSKTISGAISAANSGDTILVKPGTYSGTADLDKRLTIEGSGLAKVDGKGKSAFRTKADGCAISNISIQGCASEPGILIASSGCRIYGCTFQDGQMGARVGGTNNTVEGCLARSITGIELAHSSNSRVLRSAFYGDVGVNIANSSSNAVTGCAFYGAGGVAILGSGQNSVGENEFRSSRFAVALLQSDGNNLTKNIVNSSISGIDLTESDGNSVEKNILTMCKMGMRLARSAGNLIEENNCTRSERSALYLESAGQNRIQKNVLAKSADGLVVTASPGNVISQNNISENSYGIHLRGPGSNTLRNNTIDANAYNLKVDAGGTSEETDLVEAYSQDIDSTNTIDGKPICYVVGKSEMALDHLDCGFVGLIGCQNITVSNKVIANSSPGMLLVASENCSIVNCTMEGDEEGFTLLKSRGCLIEKNSARNCGTGFSAYGSEEDLFKGNMADNCTGPGFKISDSLATALINLSSRNNTDGISITNSKLGSVAYCNSSLNRETGILLSNSHKFSVENNQAANNSRGITLSGSNSCSVAGNNATSNDRDGISLEQLTDADISNNCAIKNGQGVFVQSSKMVRIYENNLSLNERYGLRMSTSSRCNITDNVFAGNALAGVNLVDCQENYIYHNIFLNNVYQNAIDNGKNRWDAGPALGGNYWSDIQSEANPGNTPKVISSQSTDRYPFKDPGAW